MGNPAVQQGVPAGRADVLGDPLDPVAEAQTLDLMSVARERANQPKYEFKVPHSCRVKDTDPRKLVMCELTAGQEELGAKLAKDGTGMRLASELAKLSVYSVDGKVVNHGEAGGEFYWAKWSAKVRRLVLQGYAKIHNTKDEEDDGFLESMTPV